MAPIRNSRKKIRPAARESVAVSGAGAILPAWKKNFVIGIDDCVCIADSRGRLSAQAIAGAREIAGAKEWTNKLYDEGHQICFFTTRPGKFRAATEKWLKLRGFKYHSLVMDKPEALQYHYIDDRHVQATTFRGKFSPLIRKEHRIEVFG
ncbi:MAG: phosphoheptose isomerase [Nitrososphaerales archaeon]